MNQLTNIGAYAGAAPGAADAHLHAISKAIVGPWAAVNAVWQVMRVEHRIPLRFDVEADRDVYLLDAVAITQARGLLRIFATRLINAGLVSEDFEGAITAVLGASAFTVQAFVNGEFRPKSAGVAGKRFMLASERVCRIEIDDEHQGTGVLVRPTLVATAAHVVEPLVVAPAVGAPPNARHQAAPGSLRRLKLVFGDIEDLLDELPGQVQRRAGTTALLHQDWLADHSPATPNELSKSLFNIEDVTNINAPNGPWDLAIIRLAVPPRPGLTGQGLLPTEAPRNPFELHVLHHPGDPKNSTGNPLLWSIGIMDGGLGNPFVRRLHTANTDGGSSGAPCLDGSFRIVALHQAGPRRSGGPDTRNRAVPIHYWCGKLDQLERTADVPFRKFVEIPGSGQQPVIGRRETQRRIWRACQADAPSSERLFVLRGPVGRGKRFTAHLVRAFAAEGGGIVGALDLSNAQGVDALGFANRIVGAFGTTLAGGGVRPSGLTTVLRDIPNEILPALMTELRQIAGSGQPIWLILHGFAAPTTDPDPSALALVELLMTRLAEIPQLRLVLTGWKWTLGQQLAGAVEELAAPTASDVVDHIEVRFYPPGLPLPAKVRTQFNTVIEFDLEQIDLQGADAYPQLIAAVTPKILQIGQRLSRPPAAGGGG